MSGNEIRDSISGKNIDEKKYYDCVFHRYDKCDSTLYFKELR